MERRVRWKARARCGAGAATRSDFFRRISV